ncbi:MAG: hypothetical protein KF687_11395 [Cyclobacteriaceae bacterium]|nr:hypothetical protein [Cyclobacteriaceae bacterium]
MKKINVSLTGLLMTLSATVFSQGFVAELGEDGMSSMFGNTCIVTLANGEEITGKLSGGSLVNGYLNNITVKNENGEKLKFKPEDVVRVSVKASTLAKMTMLAESTTSIKKMTQTNFDDIVKREYIIFETAMRHNKNEKHRLMQLLNPGFDNHIKVFADPNPNRKTDGIGIASVKLTGDIDKSYLFVQNGNKAVLVKKGSYKKNFEELYSKCPQMLEAFSGEKIKWSDVAGHVFAYDRVCEK